jgi:hypothetical protein
MTERENLIDRREAILRVSALLGGITLVGGSALLTACEKNGGAAARADSSAGVGEFTAADIALLDEIADTMLPETSTPGAKAAKVGAFMALMVTDTYAPTEAKLFRDGLRTLDAESRKVNGAGFIDATPAQRLALLERLDREQKAQADARDAASRARENEEDKKGDAFLPDQRKENAAGADANPAPAITADAPTHYFRMMKELALLGYFTSEIGSTKAQRYAESPGRFDPCVPYTPGEPSWAPHA